MILVFKKNFSLISETLKALDVIKDVLGFEFPENMKLEFIERLDAIGSCTYVNKKHCIISISKNRIVPSEQNYISLLIHELLHAKNPNDCHSGQWRIDAHIINNSTEYEISRIVNDNILKIDYHYEVVCPCCGATEKSINKTKIFSDIEKGNGSYRCNECGCHFLKIRYL